MRNKFFSILILMLFPLSLHATQKANYNDSPQRFEKIVLSKNVIAECDAQKGDERGPFGITYKENALTHTFLVMTGVYYDTCKDLEKRINRLKKLAPKIILIGTLDYPQKEIKEVIWRWGAVKSLSGKVCISYFNQDCE